MKKSNIDHIKEALQYAQQHSPYYQKRWNDLGIDVSTIHSIQDFQQLPTTSKDDLQKYNTDFLAVNDEAVIDLASTSGTLGKPVLFPLTQHDLERLAHNEYLSLKKTGVTKHSKILLTTTLDKQFMAGLAYFLGAQKLGASIIRSGPGLPSQKWEAIFNYKPDYMIAVPSFVLKMLEYAKEHNIDFQNTSIKKIICIGEPIRNADFEYSVLGRRIVEQWNVQLFSTYASTEKGTAFTECEFGKGGHVPEELIYIELLNEDGKSVQAGEQGEVVATTFGVQGMPLIRYRTGDVAVLHEEPCACGDHSPRLSPILGRKQQMIKFKGTTIFPQSVFEVLNNALFVLDYYLIATKNELGLDELTVVVATTISHESAQKMLVELFRSAIRVTPNIVFQELKELSRQKYKSENRKPILFLDQR